MKVKHGLVFKLRPSRDQGQCFIKFAGASRWIWNWALEKCEEHYAVTGKHLDPYDLSTLLPGLKKSPDTSWLATVHSQVPQQALRDLHNAYRKYFKEKNVGKPRRGRAYIANIFMLELQDEVIIPHD